MKILIMKHIAFWLFVSVLPSFPGQATADTAELLSGPFRETLRPTANTGGARVMGVQIYGADPLTDMQALVPKSWAGELFCVRTGTSDGLYDSENTYRAPRDTSVSVIVPHVDLSDHPGTLDALVPQAFGIRIQRDACDRTSPDSPGALALWRAADAGDAFAVLVNSFDADRLVALPDKGDPVECAMLGVDVSVAFDRICTIPFAADTGEMRVRLVPFKDGRRGLTETLTIQLP